MINQVKIGKFISQKRKEKHLTQFELAEKLDVSDRAVSKWEHGQSFPDTAHLPKLCNVLGVTMSDLFSGEVTSNKDSQQKLEQHLLEVTRLKEQKDKQLLGLEVFIGIIVSILLISSILVAGLVTMPNFCRVLIIILGIVIFFIGIHECLIIEHSAGYYECAKCHHKYIPSFASVFWAMHIGRTRYLRCPHCHKCSWNKKVISGND